MARQLKVWGGNLMVGNTQFRAIVATTTKKRAVELLDISAGEFNNFWCETRNSVEVPLGTENPETVFVCTGRRTSQEKYIKLEQRLE